MSTEPNRAEMIIIAVDLRQESRLTASRESTKHGCRTLDWHRSWRSIPGTQVYRHICSLPPFPSSGMRFVVRRIYFAFSRCAIITVFEETKRSVRTGDDLTKTKETGAVANGNISSNMAVTPAVVGFRTRQLSAAQTTSSQVAGTFPVDHSKSRN